MGMDFRCYAKYEKLFIIHDYMVHLHCGCAVPKGCRSCCVVPHQRSILQRYLMKVSGFMPATPFIFRPSVFSPLEATPYATFHARD
jgi:hypothetical protein